MQRSIEAGDKETGVTVFRIEQGLDTGDIFASAPVDIAGNDTAGSLMKRLTDKGAQVLVDTLDAIEDEALTPTPQSDDGATYAKKISTEDTRIDWNKPASTIDQAIRAVTPDPGAWTLLEDNRIRVGAVLPITDPRDAIEKSLSLAPGEIAWKKNRVWVGTADFPVQLGSVQAPGKKLMEAGAWVRGAHLTNGLDANSSAQNKSVQNNSTERNGSYDDTPHEGTRFQ